MDGGFSYALFVFWVCGSFAVLLDIDHLWTLFKRIPSVRLSESYGRPFHTRTVFIVASCFISICVVTLADGFYTGILQQFGEGGTIVFFLTLIMLTFVSTKYIGRYLLKRMIKVRWLWRHNKEKPRNVR